MLQEQLYEGAWNPALQRFRAPFAFRGQSRGDLPIANSLLTLAGSAADVHKLELSLLRNFRKYAHERSTAGVDSIWHWLAVGQHHGLPTRLVDWTYSPLVALHFATDDPVAFDTDGIVWCVDFVKANALLPRRLRAILDDEGSDTFTVEMLERFPSLRAFDALARRPFVVFLEPPSLDTRILNQFALFSLMPHPSTRIGAWLASHPELSRQVTVPAELKWEVRDKLDQANINERTLFPDLDGLSRWLQRYYLTRPAH